VTEFALDQAVVGSAGSIDLDQRQPFGTMSPNHQGGAIMIGIPLSWERS
jgi:hypothetical protein